MAPRSCATSKVKATAVCVGLESAVNEHLRLFPKKKPKEKKWMDKKNSRSKEATRGSWPY